MKFEYNLEFYLYNSQYNIIEDPKLMKAWCKKYIGKNRESWNHTRMELKDVLDCELETIREKHPNVMYTRTYNMGDPYYPNVSGRLINTSRIMMIDRYSFKTIEHMVMFKIKWGGETNLSNNWRSVMKETLHVC